ncbi:winged helix-turn-helix domain-containing protein [Nonomuraea salmonea]
MARQLGVSLRTVHRRVSELMELLGGAYPVPGGAAGRPPRLGRPCLTTPI